MHCDFETHECDYGCGVNTHKSDSYTQSVILTRMSVIMTFTSVITTLASEFTTGMSVTYTRTSLISTRCIVKLM
jgi:hypothetical protein